MKRNKIEFETFKNVSNYDIGNLEKTEPSCINFLSYKKSKITIEPIEEPIEVYIERLENLLLNNGNYRNRCDMIKREINLLKKELDNEN